MCEVSGHDNGLEKYRQTRDDEGVMLQLKGENRLVCPEQVKATVGEDVTLDCHFEFPRDVTDKLFEWKFGSQRVLVYRSQNFSHVDQAAQFKDRAHPDSSFNLTIGKLPVKISSVQTNDAGTYSCFVGIKKDRISCSTELIVEPKPEPTKGADDEKVVQHPSQSPEHGNTGIGTGVIIGIVVSIAVAAVAAGLISEPVRVRVGDDAILPCHLEPPFNVNNLTVEWKWNETEVYIYRSRKPYLDNQDENFKGRTSLFHEEMEKGNISLKVTNVT
ncbi:hypothetical protein L3Q82_016517 [Scortum barcoo]|uniref:Uncharacterized protein n=1 Tax=Scortum barcoo TaxID=214431 RepID=A0ACB8X7M8_9TELE|nr:hypothetical protein L3Q82_016517 [Scortum barcoo]